MAKARAIRIDAHLPEFLWPETVKTAAYLTNRSPTKRLNWKTPLEELQQALNVHNPKPNISHLKVYGCQAYPNIPHQTIPRQKKVIPRAHIGYLVGYESSNIFRIWVPAKQRVISSRDVDFDETKLYDPTEPIRLSQLQEEPDYIEEIVKFPQQTEEPTGPSIDFDSDTHETELDEDEIRPGQTELPDRPPTRIDKPDESSNDLSTGEHSAGLPTPEETPNQSPISND